MTVLVIDEELANVRYTKELLEGLDHISVALVAGSPAALELDKIRPDMIVLGASWLGSARSFRKRYPRAIILGRGPWYGRSTEEFYPWGDALREPALPLTSLLGPVECQQAQALKGEPFEDKKTGS